MQFGKGHIGNQDHQFLKEENNNRFRLTMSEFVAKLYSYYRDVSAGKRGHDFTLSHEELKSLVLEAKCFYCEKDPVYSEYVKDVGLIKFNGIDRVDNSIGYVPGNVVPCCKPCNTFKRNMSVKEFSRRAQMFEKIQKFFNMER